MFWKNHWNGMVRGGILHLSLSQLWLCLLFLVGCSARFEASDVKQSEVEQSGADLTTAAGPGATSKTKQTKAAKAESLPAGQRVVWVKMKAAASLSVQAQPKAWKARGEAVYKSLTNAAKSGQASLRTTLDQKHVSYKSFWAVNALRVVADDATINEIKGRSDVASVVDDYRIEIPEPNPGRVEQAVQGIEWNIANVRAPEAWNSFGTRGEGVVVATIDTGVQYDHPALARQYRGHNADGSIDHNYNWFDPAMMCGGAPCDNAGHGTHTMGTIVGDDGGDNQIGMAPGARWIAAKGCEDFSCSLESLIAAGQWMLAPTDSSGANPRPDLRPNIVSNSWGGGGGSDFYRDIVNAWVAAGMFPVFANGNAGSSCGSSGSPGDYPESYSAGAYDINNLIADFSSRGASFYGVVKPNISAPGVNVRSSVPGNGYEAFDGTSMATPHVAGAVALLWSAAPAVAGDIAATRELLNTGAVDHEDLSCGGDPGNNNVYGEGQLDIVSTLDIAPIGPTGYLAGTVQSDAGLPIAGADLTVTGDHVRHVHSGLAGDYSVRLPVGSFQVTAHAFGYLPSDATNVDVQQDATTQLDITMTTAPTFAVEGTITDSDGTPVEGATVSLPGTPLEPVLSDDIGFFVFPTVPVGDYHLTASAGGCFSDASADISVGADVVLDLQLQQKHDAYGYVCTRGQFDYLNGSTLVLSGDDAATTVSLPFSFPFYGTSVNQIGVSTNGFVSLKPSSDLGDVMIPNPNEPNGAVFAMWDDLVTGDGIYTATVGTAPNRKFVIEWRNTFFFGGDPDVVNFEIVLGENGQITTQYTGSSGQRGRGTDASIGIENPTGSDGIQYSFHQAALDGDQAVVYSIPHAGFVEGSVTDANDHLAISGAKITLLHSDGSSTIGSTDSSGHYRMLVSAGSYGLSITRNNYATYSAQVTVVENQTSTQNAALKTAKGVLTPSTLQLVLEQNTTRTRTLSLSNAGTSSLTYSLLESGGRLQVTARTAKRKRATNVDPLAHDTRGLYSDNVAAAATVTPASAGDVISSFSTGLSLGWGIGQDSNLWISDVFAVSNFEYDVTGNPTGTSHATPWAGEWAADMAFDTARNLMCQLSVGGDGAVHCWDPASGDVVDTLTGTWSNSLQRGLAYRSDDDSFYVGGWGEGIVYHVAGPSSANPGEVISSCAPADGDISGLAYNGAAGVLWVATNSMTDTIYELNPDDCTVLASFPPPQGGGFQGAGLEMDQEGNLWAVAQSPNNVYLVETDVPTIGDIPWLTLSPTSGQLAPGASQNVQLTIDTHGLTPGLYLGSVFLQSNSGREPLIRIPVSLVVSAYLKGLNAGGSAFTDSNGNPWLADQAWRSGSFGYMQRGSVNTTRSAISGTVDDRLYQDQREDPYAYRYDNVPNGVYEIDLRFAELAQVRLGQRLFDAIVENTLVLPAHDIQYEVGRNAADDQHFFVEVTDGRLDVRLITRTRNRPPVLNAIRVTHRPDR